MTNNQDQLNQLLQRLDSMSEQQRLFHQEIYQLRKEVNRLRASQDTDKSEEAVLSFSEIQEENENSSKILSDDAPPERKRIRPVPATNQETAFKVPPQLKADLEKFIGENLINKIGIAITVLGVGIGAKYSIDNQLISPLTRIIMGYLMGIGLLGFSMRLKLKYENLSAVLLSGAMAIMYFITYTAYSFYGLIPQVLCFALMVLFTVFTVMAAIHYNRQVIAVIGLAGAYAVPFLLSSGEGRAGVLFSYMAIINAGILVISYRKYWKPLYYISFALSWLIYAGWYKSAYMVEEHFALALSFLFIFFLLFYLTFLSYKTVRREHFAVEDVLLLLGNSFIFFALGYAILEGHPVGSQALGLFTLVNALIHFGVSVLIYRKKLADKNLFYLLAGMVLVFITIAIPVQLNGNWVTLLWAGQALLLLWIGRKNRVPLYELLSYPLMILAFFSIIDDWADGYSIYQAELTNSRFLPFINIHFLSSVLFLSSFAGMQFISKRYSYTSDMKVRENLLYMVQYLIPFILLVVSYLGLRLEIAHYWDQLWLDSSITTMPEDEYGFQGVEHDYSLKNFKTVWIINYSMLFLTVLGLLNVVKIKNRELGIVTLALSLAGIASFLGLALYSMSELRESYLSQTMVDSYHRGIFHILIRYVSLAFFAALLFSVKKLLSQSFMEVNFRQGFEYLFYFCLLWVLSSELISWMDIAGFNQSYKLGLSILWGIFALFLIAQGIWKKKKHLRLGAIALFTITLLKLFFFDIAELDTISKTIVFVSLGVLLLVISFLYNKYGNRLADEVEI